MEDAFFENYSSIISDRVCMSTNNECMMWTVGTMGEKVKYGVVKVRFRCRNRRHVKAHRSHDTSIARLGYIMEAATTADRSNCSLPPATWEPTGAYITCRLGRIPRRLGAGKRNRLVPELIARLRCVGVYFGRYMLRFVFAGYTNVALSYLK